MAYNSGQGGHGDSWTHQGYGGHATTSNHPWTGASRAPDQSFHVGAPATEPGDYDPNWSAGTFVNTPQLLGYDQHQQYSQPVLYKTSSMGSNAIPCNPVGTGAYYRSPGGHYSPSPNGPSGYQLEVAYSTASCPPVQAFSSMAAAHLSPSPSPISPSYPARSYSYPFLIPGASASPPGPTHTVLQPPESPHVDAEYSVPCPYRCGTVLTGVHALGNLTRHLKTQACAGSSRAKVKYPCPIDGCERQYARSDGLRVHMRRQHGAPRPIPRHDGAVDEDDD